MKRIMLIKELLNDELTGFVFNLPLLEESNFKLKQLSVRGTLKALTGESRARIPNKQGDLSSTTVTIRKYSSTVVDVDCLEEDFEVFLEGIGKQLPGAEWKVRTCILISPNGFELHCLNHFDRLFVTELIEPKNTKPIITHSGLIAREAGVLFDDLLEI